jgi:general secretion pathway protein L
MNLNKNVNIQIKPFLRWWGRELAFLVPVKVRQFFHTPSRAIIILPNNDSLTLCYEVDGKQETLTTIARDDVTTQNLATILDEARFKNAIFILRLSSQDALCKTLTLPLAAQSNINQVVSYELDRYTPFNVNQVYFATHIAQIDTDAEHLTVQLLLTPKKTLETLCKQCKELGVLVQYVDVENYPNDLDDIYHAYNLLPAHLQTKRTNTPRRIMLGLAMLLGFLSLTSLILPVWLEYQAVNELQLKIAKIEKEAKAVKSLQADIETLNEENQSLIALKTAMPTVVSVLNELSALMHDDSWLAYLQYGDGQLQLQGESPAASNLLADLEASDYFAKVNFASPVTQDKASGVERFQISAEITRPATSKTDATPSDDSTQETQSNSEPVEDSPTNNEMISDVSSENGTTN